MIIIFLKFCFLVSSLSFAITYVFFACLLTSVDSSWMLTQAATFTHNNGFVLIKNHHTQKHTHKKGAPHSSSLSCHQPSRAVLVPGILYPALKLQGNRSPLNLISWTSSVRNPAQLPAALLRSAQLSAPGQAWPPPCLGSGCPTSQEFHQAGRVSCSVMPLISRKASWGVARNGQKTPARTKPKLSLVSVNSELASNMESHCIGQKV